ncbi:unnamed protein product [Didymodactylos carnosus]|uniref:Uncharacterized protein n=1 Tax=Didymodactylos carnosus TaxID=1234261 RepID=A0A814P7I6_9BILA|nr:unnamed protein product [Didymodactylos carnosus]CAF3866775.1 unnamed protein product [Didymodactylos carnosus]
MGSKSSKDGSNSFNPMNMMAMSSMMGGMGGMGMGGMGGMGMGGMGGMGMGGMGGMGMEMNGYGNNHNQVSILGQQMQAPQPVIRRSPKCPDCFQDHTCDWNCRETDPGGRIDEDSDNSEEGSSTFSTKNMIIILILCLTGAGIAYFVMIRQQKLEKYEGKTNTEQRKSQGSIDSVEQGDSSSAGTRSAADGLKSVKSVSEVKDVRIILKPSEHQVRIV